MKISDKELKTVINNYTKESGVRELERTLETLYRKVLINDTKKPLNITSNLITKCLGKPKYEDLDYSSWHVGCANCLAYTSSGGVVLPVEACYTYKNSLVTGMLGNSMKESISVVTSYIYSHLKDFKLNEKDIDKDIHIHFLDGSTSKDGPSAGVSSVSVLLSLYKGYIIPRNIAMTGEITLSGNILKVGGLKEKLIGAYNNHITKVYIPKTNEPDLDDIPDEIKKKLKIVLVSDYIEIYKDLFKD